MDLITALILAVAMAFAGAPVEQPTVNDLPQVIIER